MPRKAPLQSLAQLRLNLQRANGHKGVFFRAEGIDGDAVRRSGHCGQRAFQQDLIPLKVAYSSLVKANPSAAEHSKLTLPSPFERSILFELGDGGVISKVMVRIELFDQVKFDGTETGNKPSAAEFDKDSAMTWATYSDHVVLRTVSIVTSLYLRGPQQHPN